MQTGPTIIEDNCFIGARLEVVEGYIVRECSVLGLGVLGSTPSKGGVSLSCAVIVNRVDARTRSKTGINELLRD